MLLLLTPRFLERERDKTEISKPVPGLHCLNINELQDLQRWARSLRMFESETALHNEEKVIEFPEESENKEV